MLAKRPEQDIAKDLYLQTDLTHQQIADILDVSRRSVWLWVKNNRWEEMKNAARQMPGIILQDIYCHITAINDKIRERDPGDRCPTKEEVESLRKLIKMTKDLSKTDVGTYMQSYGELMMYINKVDHDLASKLSKHVENFVTGTYVDREAQATRDCKANARTAMDSLQKLRERSIPVAPDHIRDKDEYRTATAEVSPFRGVGCDNDVIMCDDPVITPSASHRGSKPATDAMDKEIADMMGITIEEVRKYSEDVITAPEKKEIVETEIDRIMKLPPEQRPSPFRDGDTIWVNHIDDIDERRNNLGRLWGERKMGDIVRRYSSYRKY